MAATSTSLGRQSTTTSTTTTVAGTTNTTAGTGTVGAAVTETKAGSGALPRTGSATRLQVLLAWLAVVTGCLMVVVANWPGTRRRQI